MNGVEIHPHLADDFNEGRLELGSPEFAQQLDANLSNWPWSPTGIDWSAVGSFGKADLNEFRENGIGPDFLADSGFGYCPFAVALLTPNEPPIIGTPAGLIGCLDEVFWKYPGKRFVFGCTKQGVGFVFVPQVMAEYDGTESFRFHRVTLPTTPRD